jgi:hypothetical protein
MAMDNAYNQSAVAYENGPKEVPDHEGMHDGDKQFGKNKMPQDSKPATKGFVKKAVAKHEKAMHHGRHREHR